MSDDAILLRLNVIILLLLGIITILLWPIISSVLLVGVTALFVGIFVIAGVMGLALLQTFWNNRT